MNAKLQLELKGLIRQYGANCTIQELSNLILELSFNAAQEGMFGAESELKRQLFRLALAMTLSYQESINELEREGL